MKKIIGCFFAMCMVPLWAFGFEIVLARGEGPLFLTRDANQIIQISIVDSAMARYDYTIVWESDVLSSETLDASGNSETFRFFNSTESIPNGTYTLIATVANKAGEKKSKDIKFQVGAASSLNYVATSSSAFHYVGDSVVLYGASSEKRVSKKWFGLDGQFVANDRGKTYSIMDKPGKYRFVCVFYDSIVGKYFNDTARVFVSENGVPGFSVEDLSKIGYSDGSVLASDYVEDTVEIVAGQSVQLLISYFRFGGSTHIHVEVPDELDIQDFDLDKLLTVGHNTPGEFEIYIKRSAGDRYFEKRFTLKVLPKAEIVFGSAVSCVDGLLNIPVYLQNVAYAHQLSEMDFSFPFGHEDYEFISASTQESDVLDPADFFFVVADSNELSIRTSTQPSAKFFTENGLFFTLQLQKIGNGLDSVLVFFDGGANSVAQSAIWLDQSDFEITFSYQTDLIHPFIVSIDAEKKYADELFWKFGGLQKHGSSFEYFSTDAVSLIYVQTADRCRLDTVLLVSNSIERYSIAGAVLCNETPIVADVIAYHKSEYGYIQTAVGHSSSDGTFIVQGVPSGDYVILALPERNEYCPSFYYEANGRASATVLPVDGNVSSVDISLYERADNDAEQHRFSGAIPSLSFTHLDSLLINQYGTVPVLQYSAEHKPIGYAYTDTAGTYLFDYVANSSVEALLVAEDLPLERGELRSRSDVFIYPHPIVPGSVFCAPNDCGTVTFYSVDGKLIAECELHDGTVPIPEELFAPGMYLYSVGTDVGVCASANTD